MKYCALLVLVCFLACVPQTPVVDGVTVEIVDFTEYNDEFGIVGRVVLVVENETVVPIYSASVSLRLETNSNRYYTTIHDDRGIPPKMKVYITVEFAYLSPEEHVIDGGIKITDSFFM